MISPTGKFSCSRVVLHGPGTLKNLSSEIAQLGGTRVALVTDPGVQKAGLVDEVAKQAGTELVVWANVQPEPPATLVDKCVRFLKRENCDLVIGLGGGSSMDMAKMAALMYANEGSVTDYWGVGKVPKNGLPVIAIPTTAGTSSEISPAAVFVDPATQAKKGVRSDFLLPEVAILDPTLTLSLPQSLTASTGMDALTHAIEAYVANQATMITEGTAERGIALIGQYLREAYAYGKSLEARQGMFAGCFFAGMALAEAGVGLVHALAHTLGGRCGIPHGVANALFLPYVMEFNRIGCREKFAQIAELMGEDTAGLSLDEASRRGIEAVRELGEDLNIPQNLRALGIKEEQLEEIAQACMETQGRLLANNPRYVSLEDVRKVLHQAY